MSVASTAEIRDAVMEQENLMSQACLPCTATHAGGAEIATAALPRPLLRLDNVAGQLLVDRISA